MKIIGIDPGTIQLGVGLIKCEGSRFQVVLAETVKTKPKSSLPQRLKELYEALSEIFQIYRPDEMALESVFFGKDAKSAIKIGEARAIAMLVAAQFSVPMCEYPPTKVKQAVCGNGQAKKQQVQFMVRNILKLKETPQVDTSDALALALCHQRVVQFNQKLKPELV